MATVAMPLRRFSSAARNTSYFERVTPGTEHRDRPPAGRLRAERGRPWEQQHEADPGGPGGQHRREAARPAGIVRSERIHCGARNDPNATVPRWPSAGELSKTICSTVRQPAPRREVVEPAGPHDVRGRVDPALAADHEVEPAAGRADAGGRVGLPAVELAAIARSSRVAVIVVNVDRPAWPLTPR